MPEEKPTKKEKSAEIIPAEVQAKDLSVTSIADAKEKINDIEVFGNGDTWKLLCKASSKSQGWMKSTKYMEVPGFGVVLQVTTQQGENIAEALVALPNATAAQLPK